MGGAGVWDARPELRLLCCAKLQESVCPSVLIPAVVCLLCSPSGPSSRELRAQDLGALPNELYDGG